MVDPIFRIVTRFSKEGSMSINRFVSFGLGAAIVALAAQPTSSAITLMGGT